MALSYMTAGESHGPQLTAIITGYPAGVPVRVEEINVDLARRQQGYGRGGRMKIEKDRVEFLSGIRFGESMGSPVTLVVKNRDNPNWREPMKTGPGKPENAREVTRARPGHADLAGCMKYGWKDARNILERASARETAARVAVGAMGKLLLNNFGVEVFAHVIRMRDVEASLKGVAFEEIRERAEKSDVRCADPVAAEKMRARIDEAKERGDTVGGVVEVVAAGLPVGLGGVMTAGEKLDARLAGALMSVQAVKGVEIGMGFGAAAVWGSQVHDAIYYGEEKTGALPGRGPSGGFYHKTNNAGGVEGGISNGEPIVCRVAFKPIPTMMTPKDSADLVTKEPFEASRERSDVCAVPAAGVVAEAVVAWELAHAFLEKFTGDSLAELRRSYDAWIAYLEDF